MPPITCPTVISPIFLSAWLLTCFSSSLFSGMTSFKVDLRSGSTAEAYPRVALGRFDLLRSLRACVLALVVDIVRNVNASTAGKEGWLFPKCCFGIKRKSIRVVNKSHSSIQAVRSTKSFLHQNGSSWRAVRKNILCSMDTASNFSTVENRGIGDHRIHRHPSSRLHPVICQSFDMICLHLFIAGHSISFFRLLLSKLQGLISTFRINLDWGTS